MCVEKTYLCTKTAAMPAITSLSQLDPNGTYSFADYLLWQFRERVELIRGHILNMSPAPSMRHQAICVNLSRPIANFFYRHRCKIFLAPFDVRLYKRKQSVKAEKDIYNVVQPDLCVVCNPDLLDERGCNGAPDWIIEILSVGNTKTDVKIKFELYQEAGVSEYWIVSPSDETVPQFYLNEQGVYQLVKLHANEGFIYPALFPELEISLEDVFAL